MQYIAVSESILRKFCREHHTCFWTPVAMINPLNTSKLYLFDCSLFKYVNERFFDRIEGRLLVSFKSPLGVDEIYYGGNLGFKELTPACECNKEEIENYISGLLKHSEREIAELRDLILSKEAEKRRPGLLSRLRREHSELKAIYYGSLVRARIMEDLLDMIGYRNNTLNAHVSQSRILISLDRNRGEYHGLLVNKSVKLSAYKLILDQEKLLEALEAI